jgi:hypothetical protein
MTNDPCQLRGRAQVEVSTVRDRFDSNIGQLQECTHVFAGFFQKTQHALAVALLKLTGQFPRKRLSSANSGWLNCEN